MLLTLQPQSTAGEINEYTTVHRTHSTPRSSWSDSSGLDTSSMESSARELPPPSALVLPQPAMPTSLPPPPSQWQGTESMQQWLVAKAEEDRRGQEEERSRQEALRLEQRKVEQMMLHDSLRAGVPPPMVPLIFVGMNNVSGGSAQLLIDTVQQWVSQSSRTGPPSSSQPQAFAGCGPPTTLPPLNAQPPPPTQPSVGVHQRDMRTLATSMYTPQLPLMRAVDPPPQKSGNGSSIPSHASWSVEPHGGQNARIGPIQYMSSHNAPQSTQPQQDARQSRRPSPAISFHHWVPPGSQSQASSSIKDPEEAIPAPNYPIHASQSPNRKRKSHTAHSSIPPPAIRASEFAPRDSQSRGRSPIMSQAQQPQVFQSAMQAQPEITGVEQRPNIYRGDSTERLNPRMRPRRSSRTFKLEHEHRSPERYRKAPEETSS